MPDEPQREPFAALVAELHAAAAEQDAAVQRASAASGKRSDFDESFANESTTADTHAFAGRPTGPSGTAAGLRAFGATDASALSSPAGGTARHLSPWDNADSTEADERGDPFGHNPPRGRRRPLDAPDHEDEEDERNITEVVALDKLD